MGLFWAIAMGFGTPWGFCVWVYELQAFQEPAGKKRFDMVPTKKDSQRRCLFCVSMDRAHQASPVSVPAPQAQALSHVLCWDLQGEFLHLYDASANSTLPLKVLVHKDGPQNPWQSSLFYFFFFFAFISFLDAQSPVQ